MHIEFQAEYTKDVPNRMFNYTYRVYEEYNLPVYSVLMLLKKNRCRNKDKNRDRGKEFEVPAT